MVNCYYCVPPKDRHPGDKIYKEGSRLTADFDLL